MTRPNIRLYKKQKEDWLDTVLTDEFVRGITIGAGIMLIAIVLVNAILKFIR